IALRPDSTVEEAVRVMAERNIGLILVVDDEGNLVGVFSERDVIRRVLARGLDPAKTRLSEVMTPNPKSIDPEATVEEALRLMARLGVRHLPVVDRESGKLVGVVSVKDIEAAII
ncbi:MAG: CBS domain-containing protein, partial [Desulfurococcales archaeon]|nr:CBS domain-containing protein [Desulfurococcales archaeon]